jgi:hypothetical protein
LTVDLFGEQTVQVVAATLEAALLLLAAAMLVLLSVRIAQQAAPKPVLANVPQRISRLVPPARADLWSDAGLITSLPARAPPDPDPSERFCRPARPGIQSPG